VLGALLAARHESREKGVRLTQEVQSVFRYSTICHRYEGERQVSDWNLYLEIPKQAMGFGGDELLSGQKIRANFYKCGDKTPKPHFLSWNPIDLPRPDFHVPRFSGSLNWIKIERMENLNLLREIVFQFIGEDENVRIKPLGKGHINDSFKVESTGKEYVLQRINHHVFRNVEQLQQNIARVTDTSAGSWRRRESPMSTGEC